MLLKNLWTGNFVQVYIYQEAECEIAQKVLYIVPNNFGHFCIEKIPYLIIDHDYACRYILLEIIKRASQMCFLCFESIRIK